MLAVKLVGIEQMALVEVEKPSKIGPDEVLIRIQSVGVCGSDVHYYSDGKIGSQVVEYPFIVGHECSGIIEACGAAVFHVKVGDLVVVDPSVHCGRCDQCLGGRPHTCRNNRFLGCPGQLEGCLAEYLVMPAFTCFPVTGMMDATEAALIEPLTIGVYSVKLASLASSAASVAIFGAGPIGLSILLKLLADGVSKITMVEPLDYRLELAGKMGAFRQINPLKEEVFAAVAKEEKLLLDVVFEASGEQESVDHALKILKPGGKLVLVGIPASACYRFDMDLMRRKEITVVNVRRQNHCVEEAIDLVASRKVDVKKMVTHYFAPEETPAAFAMVAGYKDGVVKAMIDFGTEPSGKG